MDHPGRSIRIELDELKRTTHFRSEELISHYSKNNWSLDAMEKFTMFAAGVGFAFFVGLFVLWGPSPKPRKRGDILGNVRLPSNETSNENHLSIKSFVRADVIQNKLNPREKRKIIGINNLGYTCFLNSLLQALGSCPQFIQWLEKQREKKNRNFTNTLFSILNKINGFDEDFYGNVTPTEIISSLGKSWNFGPGHQDAHELFHVILNALEDEMQPVNKNGCLSDVLHQGYESKNALSKTKPGMIVARSSELLSRNNCEYINSMWSWQNLFTIPYSNTPSMETNPFSGLITSQLQCSTCMKKSSVRYDKFESLLLPLPPPTSRFVQQYTLEDLLSRFVDSEVVSDVECDRCSTRCEATKTLRLGKLPKCLCLHISRTTWSPLGSTKRDDQVIIPQTLVLDPYTYKEQKRKNAQAYGDTRDIMNGFTMTPNKYKYQLCAVIEHRGPVDSGHFVCYRRAHKENMWLYTSDIVVESVSLTQVLFTNPYMLFYERIAATQENTMHTGCS
ncbi:ubiquitin carboxyl-terminal hydrolase 30 homolog isoform X2 [Odontomachus brunneus]|uniref:ubiquitin carboxyl-terminal hydrolase 30 homolog isoform X2 n=1 Tax=Odontomachus brunneus TaxID=486640 RepID=UPI0013F236BC|nr:ubiquitin carboxyl-terminal hydrolase 30 homolog isoform X2 [Odontomachus brunneus]